MVVFLKAVVVTVKLMASLLVLTSDLIVLECGDITRISEKTEHLVSPPIYLRQTFSSSSFSRQHPALAWRQEPVCATETTSPAACWLAVPATAPGLCLMDRESTHQLAASGC